MTLDLGKAILDTGYYLTLLEQFKLTSNFGDLLTQINAFFSHRLNYYIRIEYLLEPTNEELEKEYEEQEYNRKTFQKTYKDILTVYLWKTQIYWVFHHNVTWYQLPYLWFQNPTQFMVDFRKYYYQFYDKHIYPIKQLEKQLINTPEQREALNQRITEGRKKRKLQDQTHDAIYNRFFGDPQNKKKL